MKILVTGGCGFIGSHLCQRLLNDGNEVVCLDNLMTGSMENIQEVLKNDKFTFINHNIREQIKINFKPDQIYNLACPASPVHYQQSSLETLLTCLQGSINILNFAEKNNARVLLSSTSQVYGDPLVSPQSEDYWGNVNPVGVRSCYDEGKRGAQTLFMEYNKVKRVDIRIARIFNTYGPRLDELDGRVVSNFICEALRGKPITVYGDGCQTRSFCYIDDQIDGLIKLMNSTLYNGPINIGNPQQITIKQLSNIIVKLCQSRSEIIYMELPKDDPKKRNPDITKAKQLLNWQPKVSLEEGLQKTILYFEGLYEKKSKNIQCNKNQEQIKPSQSAQNNVSDNQFQQAI